MRKRNHRLVLILVAAAAAAAAALSKEPRFLVFVRGQTYDNTSLSALA